MNEPQNKQNLKWIALSVIILFALSGGVYQFAKHRGANSEPTGAAGNTTAATHTTTSPATNTGALPGHPETYSAIVHGTTDSMEPAEAARGAANSKAPSQSAEGKSAGRTIASVAPGAGATSTAASGLATSGAAIPSLHVLGPIGMGTGSGAGAPAELAPMPGALPVVEKQDQCVTITYHHKPMASHGDDESCSHHKNMLKLSALVDLKINSASVCVRVNGTPVHYLSVKGHADELIFGAVAGPKSKVTVHYCTGRAQGCAKEDCTVPKDEFMEAIGGSEGDTVNAKLGQWDPEAPAEKEADVMAKLDGAVKKELETNDDLNGRAPAGALFKDWIGQSETAACGTEQAKN